ncbi:MAG: hypothetical protein KAX18_03315, partial [Candidatus Lokiarchaeota archaeon]|nr:hypothetical protein [Candidatus Lokiarchaeota archaeon]
LLEPLAIIRFLIINSKTQEDSVILSKGDSFDSLCSIGTLILLHKYSQVDRKSEIFFQYKPEIQKIVTKTFPLDEYFDCIEYRQGSWEVFGHFIGSEILHFHNTFTDPKIVYQVLKSLTFLEKI